MRKPETYNKVIIPAISILLLGYNMLRVIRVPVSYDEASTYFLYLNSTYKNITANIPVTANNHILNSLLTKTFIAFLGNSILVLRLANVLALVAYLWFSYALVGKLFKSDRWVIASFLLLNLNPFLFDFWGLCRGYGLAIAFMSGSLYFLLQYIEKNKAKDLAICYLMAIAAAYSNFALLNVFIALNVVVFYHILRVSKTRKHILITMFAVVLAFALCWNIIRELKDAGELYFGGHSGLVQDTFFTLIRDSLYIYPPGRFHLQVLVFAYIVAASIVCSGIYWLVKTLRDGNTTRHPGFILWSILCIILLSAKLQYFFNGTPYLIQRTALFLYPIFILQLCYFIFHVFSGRQGIYLAGVLALLATVNFIIHINCRYALSWKYGMHDYELIQRMVHQTPSKQKVKLKLYWQFAPVFKYYAENYYPGRFQTIESNREQSKETACDYYYIHRDDISIVPAGYILDTSYDDGRFLFYRKP